MAARIPAIPPPRTTKSALLPFRITMGDSIIAMAGRLRNLYHRINEDLGLYGCGGFAPRGGEIKLELAISTVAGLGAA